MRPKVAILGGGPAGLGAAYQLARRGLAEVTVLEQQQTVGGNAGSFELEGVHVDYGSHRLHPACAPAILADLRQLLGDDLLLRPRHGRIRLRNRWIHFPLDPLDLALHLPPAFALGVARDLVVRPFAPRRTADETFASLLEAGLGGTMCREFYFPYARKIWGVEPGELSPEQARRRVSANSPTGMLRKILHALPGLKPPGSGRFYYPRRGYGQISECLAGGVCRCGGEVLLGAKVCAVEHRNNRITAVRYETDGAEQVLEAGYVWSTVPVTALIRALDPPAPAAILNAAAAITFRGLVLVYLVLEQDRFTEYDAHYFPGDDVPVARLSEPKNYSGTAEPRGITVLCAEVPSDPGSPAWQATDESLGRSLCGWLGAAGLPVHARVRRVVTRRLPQGYPIYRRGYETRLEELEGWIEGMDGLLTFGRQGLFAHDNLHHTLAMAYAAAACFEDGIFDRARWRQFRRSFDQHVVED